MASQQEAEQALEAALQMLASGAVTHGALTLGEYWRTWYERTTHRSRKDDAGLWGRYLAGKSLAMMPSSELPRGDGRLPCREITPSPQPWRANSSGAGS